MIPGHKTIRYAALFGFCFVIAHTLTITITVIEQGWDWGFNAWVFDLAGFAAGAYFADQSWKSAHTPACDFRKGNRWIFIWALATIVARGIDVMMLFGIIKWNALYTTPTGGVLYANIVSEVFFGTTFTILALLGSYQLLSRSSDATIAKQ